MTEDGRGLVARVHREFLERNPPPPPREPPTIHFTELPPAQEGWAIAAEWETYRREVGRLLAEGNEIFRVTIVRSVENRAVEIALRCFRHGDGHNTADFVHGVI